MWYDINWRKRLKITVDADKVDADLTNFPIYLNLANLGSDFFDNVKSDGGDIRITTSDGETEVPVEVVSIDTGAETGEVHFKAPSLANSSDTEFYIYFDNPSATLPDADDTYGSQNVWSDYVAVYHLVNGSDSTANDLNLTATGSPTDSSGKLGSAKVFSASSSYYSISNANAGALKFSGGNLTISAWAKPTNTSGSWAQGYILSMRQFSPNKGYFMAFAGGTDPHFFLTTNEGNGSSTGVTVSNGNWYYLVGTYDSVAELRKVYQQGSEEVSVTRTGNIVAADTAPFYLALNSNNTAEGLTGELDEIRLSAITRSADWISTEYNNQNSPNTFYAIGSLESLIEQTQTITAKGLIKEAGIRTIQAIQAKGRIVFPPTTTTISGLKAQARILPSQAFIDGVHDIVRHLQAKIEVKWDGLNWTDETDYFLSARGNEKLQGSLGEGMASTLDVELDNTTERFTPDNTNSPIYAYLKPRTPIRVSVVVAEYAYRLFTGYIKNLHPDTRTRIVSFECFDNQVLVYNKRANGIVYEDFRTDQLLRELAELADLDPELFTFDIGDTIVNFGYFEDRNVWPLMGEIAVAERGRVFFDRYGHLVFWNRSKLHNRKPSFTITLEDWVKDLDYSVAEHEIKNAVIVKAAPRFSAGIQVVWSNGNAEFLDPYSDTLVYIPPNTAQNVFLELEDPCTTFIVPVPNTDYVANSTQTGTGDDLTSDVEVTEFINFGNAVFLTVENKNQTTGAFLTHFQIRGNPAKVLKWIKVTSRDQESIDAYGRQEFELENNFITSEEAATQIADEELERRREAINLFRVDIIGVPYLLTGDVIDLEYRSGMFKEYMIETMDWTLDESGFNQRLTLTNPYTFPEVENISAKGFIIHGDKIAHIQAKGKIA